MPVSFVSELLISIVVSSKSVVSWQLVPDDDKLIDKSITNLISHTVAANFRLNLH